MGNKKIGYDTFGEQYPADWDDELVRCAWCGCLFPLDADGGSGALCCACQDKIDAKKSALSPYEDVSKFGGK